MGVIARPLPIRPLPWRPLAIVALLGSWLRRRSDLRRLAAALAAAVRPGPQRRPVIGDRRRRHRSVDPATGTTTPLITGPTLDSGPFSPMTAGGSSSTAQPTRRHDVNDIVRRERRWGPTSRPRFPAGPEINWFELVTERRPRRPRAETVNGRARSRSPIRDGRADTRSPDRRLGRDVAAEPRPDRRDCQVGTNARRSGSSTPTGRPRQIPVSTYAINSRPCHRTARRSLTPPGSRGWRAGSESWTSTSGGDDPSRPST